MSVIYCISSPNSPYIYIGKTTNLKERMKSHCTNLKKLMRNRGCCTRKYPSATIINRGCPRVEILERFAKDIDPYIVKRREANLIRNNKDRVVNIEGLDPKTKAITTKAYDAWVTGIQQEYNDGSACSCEDCVEKLPFAIPLSSVYDFQLP